MGRAALLGDGNTKGNTGNTHEAVLRRRSRT